MAATVERHREISAQFMDHAEDEFRKGDLLQASEKAWGAVAHFVHSVARQRGWEVGSHARLRTNVNRLIRQDPAHADHRRRLFRSLEAIHANFYQEFLDEDDVRDGIDDAKELIRALEALSEDVRR